MASLTYYSLLLTLSLLLLTPLPSSPFTLQLLRRPSFADHSIHQHRAHDLHRHSQRFSRDGARLKNFPLQGSFDIIGLYYTQLLLGSPPKEFNVAIDTGSDVMWISCGSCTGCPKKTLLPVQLRHFDPATSSSSSVISCSDPWCRSDATTCDQDNNQCTYEFDYKDSSSTSGYFVSDTIHLTKISNGSKMINSSIPIAFGCSNLRTGRLSSDESALDGIFGLGHDAMSINSQLYSQGVAPAVFSHCLRGDSVGGGVLILGEIVEPNIVYSKLVPSQLNYNLDLQSISVNGHMLEIDPAVFTTSNFKGAAIDSGTNLAYLPEKAYRYFVDAIAAAIPSSIHIVDSKGHLCYSTTKNIKPASSPADVKSHVAFALSSTDGFPQVSLNFADGASLVLKPQDYLLSMSHNFYGLWCLGIQKGDIAILGDIMLKDRFFIYDIAAQQIGWVNYNCSLPINVSTPHNKFKTGESSCIRHKFTMTKTWVLVFLLHLLI